MKFGNDHVITVHGFIDDLGTCQEIVTAMNFNTCKETDCAGCRNPYSCASPQPLNANPIYKNAHIPLRHSERSEGSSDGLYILAGFFATLRMTGV